MKNYNLKNEKRLINAAIVAGIMLLFNLIIPTLGYVFIQSKLYTVGNPTQTVINVMSNPTVFYYGIISELILSIGLIALGYALYVMVKHINSDLALFALILKSSEAVLMAVVALISFLAFHLLDSTNNMEEVTVGQVQFMAGIVLNKHSLLNAVPMIFLGLEMILFNMLLMKSHLIPKLIAGFGIFSFALILIYSLLSIFNVGNKLMLLTIPSFIYELICGIWLLINGPSRIRLINAN